MTTVNSCCCFDLETGGKILAWLGIIFSLLTVLFGIPEFFGIMMAECYELNTYQSVQQLNMLFDINDCSTLQKLAAFSAFSEVVTAVAHFIISLLFLKAINQRNPFYVIPILVIDGIGLGFIGIIIFILMFVNFIAAIFLFIIAMIPLYLFLVEYSIYIKIRDERQQNPSGAQIEFSKP